MMKLKPLLTSALALATLSAGPLLLGAQPPPRQRQQQSQQQRRGQELKDQQPKVIVKDVPPAPALSPQQALESFRLAPGFRLEVVAAEPMVQDPVALTFDPDGRIYVVEMRGYMPDADGTGEDEPVGRVSLLEDTDGDGRADKSTVFLDGLVMPRAVAFAGGGVLVAEPPKLWFCRDVDGDGRADEKTAILNDYATEGTGNPEHAANGLVRMLDNWHYSAKWPGRIRPGKDGKWLRQPTPARGQWGICQDDVGRIYYNSNPSQLHADLLPSDYTTRNPFYTPTATGKRGTSIAENQAIFPARVTPGTNRSYYAMGPDGKIHNFTAACGPLVYRGDAYPPEFYGNAFVAEPAAHLIKRDVLVPDGLNLTAKSVHTDIDFLCSVDERFRPVNLYNAPDGTIYIVDMYRGILQHRRFLTAYLRDQIEQRDLASPIHYGRIYRLVHESKTPTPAPKLSKATTAELVQHLSHPRGWVRDMAQQLLVETNDRRSPPLLKKVIRDPQSGLAALHALWTLDGQGRLDVAAVQFGMAHAHPAVRTAAVRLADPMYRQFPFGPELVQRASALANDPDPSVRAQVLMSLSPFPEGEPTVTAMLNAHVSDPWMRDAAMTGMAGRELEYLNRFLSDPAWKEQSPGRPDLIESLAAGVVAGRSNDRITALLDLIADQPTGDWRQLALLQGMSEASAASRQMVSAKRPVKLQQEPTVLVALAEDNNPDVQQLVNRAAALLTWPGKPGAAESKLKPLTPEQQARFEEGRAVYASTCAACHQPTGLGLEGLAPPLFDADWVLGPDERLARIVLHGVTGPIQVHRRVYEMEMPGLGDAFTDAQVAAVMTYVRREWGHEADPVEPEAVAKVRRETANRQVPWTAEELKKVN